MKVDFSCAQSNNNAYGYTALVLSDHFILRNQFGLIISAFSLLFFSIDLLFIFIYLFKRIKNDVFLMWCITDVDDTMVETDLDDDDDD